MSDYPNAPGHRNIETSVAAADAVATGIGRLQRIALQAIRDVGAHGATADELAALLGMDRWSFQPSTSETKQMRLICTSGQRRPNCTGKLAIGWIAQ